MAGKGTFSVSQTPQYGDKVALERLQTNTETPMSGAPIERRGAGRPAGSGQPAPAGREEQLPPQHRQALSEIAQALQRMQYFEALNAALDTPETRMYKLDSQREFQRLSIDFESDTPNWDIE